jgi:hypothetical protein
LAPGIGGAGGCTCGSLPAADAAALPDPDRVDDGLPAVSVLEPAHAASTTNPTADIATAGFLNLMACYLVPEVPSSSPPRCFRKQASPTSGLKKALATSSYASHQQAEETSDTFSD